VAREHVRAKIVRAQGRLAQLHAREALREMRRTTEWPRSRPRRQHARWRFELGDAVADAGLEGWSKAELRGLLLRVKDQFGESELMRRMLEAHAASANGGAGSSRVH
jgi:hypothetical protein